MRALSALGAQASVGSFYACLGAAPSRAAPPVPGWQQDTPWPHLLSLLACDFCVGSGWCTGICEEAGQTGEGGGSRVNRAEGDNRRKIPRRPNTALQHHLNPEKPPLAAHLPVMLIPRGQKPPTPNTHARTHTHTHAYTRLPPSRPHTSPAGTRVHLEASMAGPRALHTTTPVRHDCSARPAWTCFQCLTTPCPGAPLTSQRPSPPHTLFWVHQCPHKPTAIWKLRT